MQFPGRPPSAGRSGPPSASVRRDAPVRTAVSGTARWSAITGATLLAAIILDFWIMPQRAFPALYLVPLLLAAHHLSRLAVLLVGLLTAVAHLVALWTVADLGIAWGIDLLALGATLWLAFWIAAQREELARRAAQERAAAADRERDRLDHLAVVAHELRNPLAAMNGFVQMLRRRERYDEHLVAMIARQGRRVDRLARDLSDLALPEAVAPVLERHELELRDLVDEVVENARMTSHRHRFRLFVASEPLIGRWDPDRLEQILDNLIGNAVKYSPEGDNVVIRLARVGESVRLTVSDSGVGISPRDVPFVFDRFYRSSGATSHVRGLGLGLYVVRRLVEAHGGHVTVSSTVGRGTTFIVMLPFKATGPRGEECRLPVELPDVGDAQPAGSPTSDG